MTIAARCPCCGGPLTAVDDPGLIGSLRGDLAMQDAVAALSDAGEVGLTTDELVQRVLGGRAKGMAQGGRTSVWTAVSRARRQLAALGMAIVREKRGDEVVFVLRRRVGG